jgi:hypothetical protein
MYHVNKDKSNSRLLQCNCVNIFFFNEVHGTRSLVFVYQELDLMKVQTTRSPNITVVRPGTGPYKSSDSTSTKHSGSKTIIGFV